MSKHTTKQRAADAIASDALDAIEYARNFSSWLAAVMRSIQLDAQHNEGRNVRELANLGQYLGDDCAGYMTSEGERLARDLDTAEG